MSTTTNIIQLSFEVDADSEFTSRLLDDLVRHIQAFPNIRSMNAKHVCEVNHWGSMVPMERQTLRRQEAVSLDDDTVSTIPYASSTSIEDSPYTISEYKRAYLLKHEIGDLYTNHDYFTGRLYPTQSGEVNITEDGYINYRLYETDELIHVGFWNETLDGWVIPSKHYTVIKEAFTPRIETD